MWTIRLFLTTLLAAQILAQCDRAADCAASDPWFYQCTDGTRADYTDCANTCCAEMNTAICSDPVQSFDYDGCMNACSASAAARCGPQTTTIPTTSSTSATTSTASSSSSSSPSACLDSRAPTRRAAGGGQCVNSLLQSCRNCHRGGLKPNGNLVTVNGCGRLQDEALRNIQESRYPKMTEVCNAHDRCFGTCQAGFKSCNDALVAGAYQVCDEMASEREQWCLNVMKMSKKDCREEREVLYSNCVGARGELVYVTKAAVKDPGMCEAFNDAQKDLRVCEVISASEGSTEFWDL